MRSSDDRKDFVALCLRSYFTRNGERKKKEKKRKEKKEEKKVSSAENPKLLKGLYFKTWGVSEYSLACIACCQEYYFSNVCLPSVFSFPHPTPLQIFFTHEVKRDVNSGSDCFVLV